MTAYLDSSVALDYILEGGVAIHHLRPFATVVASELLEIECRRVIARARFTGALDDDGTVAALARLEDVLARTTIVALSRVVRQRAMASFPLPVRTLDAFHLATAELVAQEPAPPFDGTVVVMSLDAQLNRCARAMGLAVGL